MKKETKINLIIICFISVLCLFLFRESIFTNKEILFGLNGPTDLLENFLPFKDFAYNSLRNLTIPLWNPYLFCGSPFLAIPQTAIFYPIHFIMFLILPLLRAYNYSVVLHLILAGVFTYYYARYIGLDAFCGLICGFVFMSSSIFILHATIGHLDNITSMIWLPLILLFLEKFLRQKKISLAILTGIILGIQILSGHLQYVFYTFIAVALYVLFYIFQEKDLGGKKIIVKGTLYLFLIGIFISAIQLIPTAELLMHSTRSVARSEFTSFFSLPPYNLITLIIPGFFGNMTEFPYWGRFYFWEMCIYIGILPLLLAAISVVHLKKNKHIFYFFSLAVISLFLATGYNIPFIKLILVRLPILNLFRGHAKFIFLTSFSLSILSGFGIKIMMDLREKCHINKKIVIWFILAGLIISGIYVSVLFMDYDFIISKWTNILSYFATLNKDIFLNTGYYANADFIKGSFIWSYLGGANSLLFAIISLFFIFLLLEKRIRLNLVKLFIFSFILIDLWKFDAKFIATFYEPNYSWNKNVTEFLKSDEELFRISQGTLLASTSNLYLSRLNAGMINQISTMGGYSVLLLKQYTKFMSAAQYFYSLNPVDYVFFTSPSKLLDLINLKYIFIDRKIKFLIDDFELCFTDNEISIYRNLKAFPRIFMVPEAKIIKDDDLAFKELKADSFTPKKYVILEEEPPIIESKKNTENYFYKIQIKKYIPNEVLIETKVFQSGYLVLSDSYYPGWKVYVDNKIDKIYRANYFMRAVYLKEGDHTIRFVYDPVSFKIGFIITLLTALIISVHLIYLKMSSKL